LASVQTASGKHYGLSTVVLHTCLGNALAKKQLLDDALAQYREAIALDANFADAHSNAATILLQRGNVSGAIAEYEKALAIPPEDAVNHVRLGTLLWQTGSAKVAASHYRRALEIDPTSAEARNGLALCSQTAR
jgi:Tfp pilus assembly protein PilF